MMSALEASETAKRIGKYRILAFIGQGAMGEVFLAEDPHIARRVAIKLMKTSGAEDGERFLREARIVGALSHPSIVVLHDFGFTEEGRPFLVMEYLEGLNLDAWLKQEHTLAEHLLVMEGLVDALAYAHAREVLHRDLKPANVRVMRDGRSKLMDFGIARGTEVRLTATGAVMGTPGYVAPEILDDARYSRRADIYSLGVVLYEMLAGGNPFIGQTLAASLQNVLTLEPPPVCRLRPEVPEALGDAVMACLAKEPRRRSPDLSRLLEAIHGLRAAGSGSGVSLPARYGLTLSIAGGLSTRRRRRKKLARASAAAAFVLVAALAVWLGVRAVPRPIEVGSQAAIRGTASTAPPTANPSATVTMPKPETPAAAPPRVRGTRLHEAPRPAATAAPATAPPAVPAEILEPPAARREQAVATPEPRPDAVQPRLRERDAATAQPGPVLSGLAPRTARRGTTTDLELRGSFLRSEHKVRVLRGRQDSAAVHVTRQSLSNDTLIRLTLLIDEDAPLGLYSLVLQDESGRPTNSLTLEVIL